METAIALVIAGVMLLLCIYFFKVAEKRRRRKEDEREQAEAAAKHARVRASLAAGAVGVPMSKRASSSYVPPAPAPQTTVVHQDSGMSPLTAGVIGYALAGGFSGNSHAKHDSSPALDSCKPEERTSYSSGGSDDGGNSYSCSSDSGSSYDSGSSGGGDSGGGGGGGGD